MTDDEFHSAFRTLNPQLIQYAASALGTMYSDDAVQLAWLDAWAKRADIFPAKLKSWMMTVTRRKHWRIVNYQKGARSKTKQTEWLDKFNGEDVPESMIFNGEQEDAAERALLYRAIGRMNVPKGSPIIETMRLVAQEGGVAEAAKARGVSEQGARQLYEKGVQALREQWGLT